MTSIFNSFASLPLEVEPVPWWAYLLITLGILFVGGLIRLEFKRIRDVQVGVLVPKSTYDLVIASKDGEIERLHRTVESKDRDVERWVAAYHIKDQAYVDLAQSIDENTDAMRLLAAQPQHAPPTRNTEATTNVNRQRRERP
jgi:hypothetical protein